jgi:hypothetical protein
MEQESGYNGKIISLGGVEGIESRGRQLNSGVLITDPAFILQVLPDNPRRISALLQNSDAAIPLYIIFGDQSGNIAFYLAAGQPFQIDQNFPWTGAVYAGCAAGSTLNFTEVSVP